MKRLLRSMIVVFTFAIMLIACSGGGGGGGPVTSKYSLSGGITSSGGSGISNAVVSLSGPVKATVKTDARGNYIFNDLVDGNYTISPSKDGDSFTRSRLRIVVNGADVSGQNFKGYAITKDEYDSNNDGTIDSVIYYTWK